jgi:hypothetical protein
MKSRSMQTFDDACRDIGASLAPFGFTYRSTKRRAFRRGPLFEHLVAFSTSRSINSIPGEVHLSVNALARSDDLAAYRRTIGWKPEHAEPYLFDIPIENILRDAPPYIRYSIGSSGSAAEVLAHVMHILSTEVLPFFDLLEDPAALRKATTQQRIPCLTSEAIEHYAGFLAAPSR